MPFDFPTYTDFLKNPLVALLFICVMALGYLYVDGRNREEKHNKELEDRIVYLESELKEVREDYDTLKDKLIETTLWINKQDNK